MSVAVVTFLPSKAQISVEKGTPLLDAFLVAGFLISSPCGGQGTCGRCKVVITNGAPPADESRHLSHDEIQHGIRLACQTIVAGDMTITVPEVPGETLVTSTAQRRISPRPRKPLNPDCATGIAIDLGTTSVSIALVDIPRQMVLGTATDYNRQLPFGADIIHRIVFAKGKREQELLQQAALATIRRLTSELAGQLGITPETIGSAVITGNPTMVYLLLGIAPGPIRELGGPPLTLSFAPRHAKQLGLPFANDAPVFIAPGVANYFGGDITAGFLTTDLPTSTVPSLFLDLGTNGELALGNRDWLMGCACSSGPAFEGMGISCGMRAVPGAIDTFSFADGKPHFSVIGDRPPAGFCGSGLIDLLAELLRTEQIDAAGRFTPHSTLATDAYGRKILTILTREQTGSGSAIRITENDLRGLVRTKAAIFAGIRVLLRAVKLDLSDVGKIYISGGIGSHLNFHNAVAIGLLPPIAEEHFIFLGNSSLKGAQRLLISHKERQSVHDLAERTTYLDLSLDTTFHDEFTAASFLPHTDVALFTNAEQ